MREKLKSLKALSSNVSVLYVEDDDTVRLHYAKFLSNFFNNITLARDGLEGLELAAQSNFDLVISDMVMPRMSGLDMIEHIKMQNPQQVSVLISAHNEVDILERALAIGVDGYLFKPLDKNKSIDILSKVLTNINLHLKNLEYRTNLESLVDEKTQELINTFSIDTITQLYSLNKLQRDIILNPSLKIAICKIRGFKAINDIYGYYSGDALLLKTAQILQKSFSQELGEGNYSLYRASGTHFVILSDVTTEKLYSALVKVIESYESSEIEIENETLFVEMDGAVVDEGSETSLSNADKALRESQNKKSVILYKTNVYEEEERKNKIKCKDRLSSAIKNGRIIPYYQPIVCNNSNKVVKFEALARLILPDGEVVSPALFLPIAKESKLYHNITHAIISQAFDDFKDLPYSLSINISTVDIHNRNTREFIAQALKKFPQPQRIVFEILESEEMHSYAELQEFIKQAHSLGAKVAIDDFGSGYSNFNYLSKLNVDYVKIDGSLIRELLASFASKTIVEMLSNFAAQMNIKTIAEFVSCEEIKNLVLALKIDESQGYHFAEPLPLSEALEAL